MVIAVRVDHAATARVAGAPGFEFVEGFWPSHLADRNAIVAKAQRAKNEIRERGPAVFGAHGDEIGRRTLQFARTSMVTTRSAVLATSVSSALVSLALRVEASPATRILARDATPRHGSNRHISAIH